MTRLTTGAGGTAFTHTSSELPWPTRTSTKQPGVTYAKSIGEHMVVCLSAQNLGEEEGTDEVLSRLVRMIKAKSARA